jgi:hypothetical protein
LGEGDFIFSSEKKRQLLLGLESESVFCIFSFFPSIIGISTQQLPIKPLAAFHLQRFSSFATQNCLRTTAQFSSLLPLYHQVNKQLWRPPQPQIHRQYTTSASNGKSNGKKDGNGQKHKKEEEQVPPEGLFKKLHFYLKQLVNFKSLGLIC